MSEKHSEFEVDELNSEPSAFSRDSIIGIIALFAGIIISAQAYGMTILLVSTLGCLLFLLGLVVHFAYRCHQNKKDLYIAYKEMEKRANTQSKLRERAENEISQLKNLSTHEMRIMICELLANARKDESK